MRIALFFLIAGCAGKEPAPPMDDAKTDHTSEATALSGCGNVCLLLASGAARCFGTGSYGEIEGAAKTPPSPYLQVEPQAEAICARTATGVSCWGAATALGGAPAPDTCSMIGPGPAPCSRTPQPLTLPAPIRTLATCASAAITTDRRLLRWGTDAPSFHPTADPIDDVAFGYTHLCYVTDGKVKCSGANTFGQLGRGTYGSMLSDSAEEIASLSATAVYSGGDSTCARRSDGSLVCWGDNTWGQLGSATTEVCAGARISPEPRCSTKPVDVALGGKVQKVVMGSAPCALLENGTVSCWGDISGSIRKGPWSSADSKPPTTVDIADVVDLAGGGSTTCALVRGGALRCWGRGFTPNADGSYPTWTKPTDVPY